MKRVQCKNLIVCVWSILSFSLFLLLFFGPNSDDYAKADSSEYSLFVWQTVNSGGGLYISSGDTLISTVGQVWVGEMQGGSYKMGIGWACEGSPTKVEEEDEDENIPSKFSLSQNYPNPFNPTTRIEFSLAKSGFVSLNVYDILGKRVRTLVSGDLSSGYRSVLWDGKNEQGEEVASGIYFYRIKAGEFAESKKMILMK